MGRGGERGGEARGGMRKEEAKATNRDNPNPPHTRLISYATQKVLWSSWWRSVESGIIGLHLRSLQGLSTRLFVILKEGGLEAVTTGEVERLENKWHEMEGEWRKEWYKGKGGL